MIRTNPVLENTFAFFYLFAYQGSLFADVALDFSLFLVLIFAMASYGYLLNDAVDCARDVRHGINNVFSGYTSVFAGVVVCTALLLSLPFVVYFAAKTPLFIETWLVWLACTSLYSLPGIYLKGRGLVGLITVALALRTLPIALILVVFGAQPNVVSMIILAYVTLRGFGGDLSHQITDYRDDLADGLETYVARIGRQRARILLDRVLEVERVALLLTAAATTASLVHQYSAPNAVIAIHAVLVGTLAILTIYAGIILRRGARGYDPHAPEYPAKDVFYLLHKSIPKIVLAVYFLTFLILQDWRYVWVALPLAIYFRLYSVSRVLNALHLRPDPGVLNTHAERQEHEDR